MTARSKKKIPGSVGVAFGKTNYNVPINAASTIEIE